MKADSPNPGDSSMTDTPDPWRELREAAEAESKAQELYGGRGNELGKHVATVLALLAERDRLAELAESHWQDLCHADERAIANHERAEQAEAALRKSEERAGELDEVLNLVRQFVSADDYPSVIEAVDNALAKEATNG